MEKMNYTNMAKELLGDKLYFKFINEIAKENKDKSNLIDFGKEVIEKCCLIIVMLGMSEKIKLDTVGICLENEVINISCKKIAKKYKKYIDNVKNNISTVLEANK